MTVIDFAPAVTAVAPLALAAVTAAVPYGIVLAERVMKVKLSAQQTAAITLAADKGAELAYGFMVGQGASLAHVAIKNAAIAQGVNHVLASVPKALRKQGITPEHVERMVEARFQGLVARQSYLAPAPMLPPPSGLKPAQDNPALVHQPVPVQAVGDPPGRPAQPSPAPQG